MPGSDVVSRPEARVGGNGDEQQTVRRRHTPQFGERAAVVPNVLQDVQARHEVESTVRKRELLHAGDEHRTQAAVARMLDHARVHVDARHGADGATQMGKHRSRSAPDVENRRVGR
jgi:hypothetical protein